MEHWYERIKAHRDERMGYQEALKIRLTLAQEGQKSWADLALLDAQRRYAAALTKEYNAIAEYNNAMARFEWSKGATLRYNNVHIGEGPLPQAVQVRAVEYEKERSKAFVLMHRPDSLQQPGRHVAAKASDLPIIETPAGIEDVLLREKLPAPKKSLPEAEALPAPKMLPEAKVLPPLPLLEESKAPGKTVPEPALDHSVPPVPPLDLPRVLAPQAAPAIPKEADPPIDFKSSPKTPNPLPDLIVPNKSISPIAPALQSSTPQRSTVGTVTVETSAPKGR
jgi:hypothetical protein